MFTPVPSEERCGRKAVQFGEVQTCGRAVGHDIVGKGADGRAAVGDSDPTSASVRMHQDFETGYRWPTTLDNDPLRDFVHVVSRDSLGGTL